MNSLVNYGSDDDYDDSSEEKQTDSYPSSRSHRKLGQPRQADVNYDEVQMSLSEDSSDESKPTKEPSRRQSRDKDDHHREESRRWNDETPKSRDDYRSRKDRTERKDDRYLGRSQKPEEDRSKNSNRQEERSSNREEERSRDRYRGDKDEERRVERRGKSRERYNSSRDDRYRDSRDRKERERRRSRSPRDRDRRRSRSPRKPERSRSRSRSKDRNSRGGYSKRYDRASSKMERLDKMDLQKSMGDDKSDAKDRFFMPGITGRFRDQIEKRKLLWQKKEPEKPNIGAPSAHSGLGSSRTTKVWEATTFAQDTDGKVANKFKRLMGIRNPGEGSNTAVDVLKKQEEMFSSMEQQYEVARTATHTMRGVGLGFGSYQR